MLAYLHDYSMYLTLVPTTETPPLQLIIKRVCYSKVRGLKRFLIPLVLGGLGGIIGCMMGIFLGLQGSPPFNIIGAAFVEGSFWLPMQIFDASYLGMLFGGRLWKSLLIVALQWGLIVTGIVAAVRLIRQRIAKKTNTSLSD